MRPDVRSARFEDLEDLRKIERLAGERFRQVGLDSVADEEPPSIEELAEYAHSARAWVAVDDIDIPVGYILVDEIDGATHIEQLTVRPDRQGQGLGIALIFEVAHASVRAGRPPSLTLTTFDHVPWNRPLFEHLGFQVLADSEIGEGLRAVREAEAARGLDPAMRVAMRLDFKIMRQDEIMSQPSAELAAQRSPRVGHVRSGYWRSSVEDEAMQDEHGFIWRAMLETIDMDLGGARVLDAGCNRGGFLRMLVDGAGVAEGYGYDPASAAVADARQLCGDRPLTFEVADTVPAGWGGFDVAFSHEVLYLLAELRAHAEDMFAALRPSCPYFAVMGVHAGSQMMAAWHAANARDLDLPHLHDLDEVANVFEQAGFEVGVARLRFRFVPVSAHRARPAERDRLAEWLDYYYDDKVIFRFTRPR